MKFEWNEGKKANNLEKHGISFEEATDLFDGRDTKVVIDDRKDYGEVRFIAMGASNIGNVLVVVFVVRNDAIRIISARKANKKERNK